MGNNSSTSHSNSVETVHEPSPSHETDSPSKAFEFFAFEIETDVRLWALYDKWRNYYAISRSSEEKLVHFNEFKRNVKFVYRNNQGVERHTIGKFEEGKTFTWKLNKFTDMTAHEFETRYVGSEIMLVGNSHVNTGFMYNNVSQVPISVDWRKKGAVTPVKNQGRCGCCWAFSAIAAVEGINAIKTKKPVVSLSAQQLIDCDTSRNRGCAGGLRIFAFEFIVKNGGISTESSYPYRGQDGECDISKANNPAVTIDGYEYVLANNENALMAAVANQPVSVAIDATDPLFKNFVEDQGVYKGIGGTKQNHAVTIVGYDATADGTKYWIVKNSWGKEWGEQGYIRMLRGIDSKYGTSGIAMNPVYPVKNSSFNHTYRYKDEL